MAWSLVLNNRAISNHSELLVAGMQAAINVHIIYHSELILLKYLICKHTKAVHCRLLKQTQVAPGVHDNDIAFTSFFTYMFLFVLSYIKWK